MDNDQETGDRSVQNQQMTEAQSRSLKKKLRLRDLVLAQILFILSPTWIGAAALQGSQHHMFYWLLTMPLFFLPLVLVVTYLMRQVPLEGGLYQWAKFGFNDKVGFMVAWNLWLYVILYLAQLGLIASAYCKSIFKNADWWASAWFPPVTACVIILLLVVCSTFGFGLGNWIHNTGSIITMIAFAAVIAVPIVAWMGGTLSSYHPFEMSVPDGLSKENINIFTRMAAGGLAGLEYVAIFAGECSNARPERDLRRSVFISAPVLVVLYILGTSSVLAFGLNRETLELAAPIPQVLALGLEPYGTAAFYLGSTISLCLLWTFLAYGNLALSANSRLFMVAGWDHLLPGWFAKKHEKYKTPVNSILLAGAVSILLALAFTLLNALLNQESWGAVYQILSSIGGVFFSLAYLVLFAIPIVGLKNQGARPSLWLKLAAATGFVVTLLYIVFQIYPIIDDVKNLSAYAVQISLTTILANFVGLLILYFGEKRRRRAVVA
ncbi:MAG TPA: APC family permease [Pyrinomonadaceae bacterium]|nr:APC family permease [Pyrinomonadaceae bacterium]